MQHQSDLGWSLGAAGLSLAAHGLSYALLFAIYDKAEKVQDKSYGDMAATMGPIYLGLTPLASSLLFSQLADLSKIHEANWLAILVGGYCGAALQLGWGTYYLKERYQEHQRLGPVASLSLLYLPLALPVLGETIAHFASRQPRPKRTENSAKNHRWTRLPVVIVAPGPTSMHVSISGLFF